MKTAAIKQWGVQDRFGLWLAEPTAREWDETLDHTWRSDPRRAMKFTVRHYAEIMAKAFKRQGAAVVEVS